MSDEMETEVVEEQGPTNEEIEVFVEGLDDIPPRDEEEEKVPDEYKKLTKAQLIEKIRENEQALSKASDSSQAIREAIGELGTKLQPQPAPAPTPPVQQQPQESDAEYEERLKNEFLDNPRKALDEHLRRQVGPLINSSASGLRQLARELVRNQKGAEAFDKYAAEIDAIASQAPIQDVINKPREVYEGAYNQVMAGHLDDLISVRVAEEVAKLQVGQNQPTPAPTTGVRAPYGATTTTPAPKVKRVVLTERERQAADMKGLDYKTYARIYKGA